MKCSLSIVSHGHGSILIRLLDSLVPLVGVNRNDIEVILTMNVPEPDLMCALGGRSWPFELKLIHNVRPQGFGTNHNQAFQQTQGQWFGVINPDIIWLDTASVHCGIFELLDFVPLSVGVVAPAQVDMQGKPQDSLRKLVTPKSAVLRTIQRWVGGHASAGVAVSAPTADWVNAACLIFRSDVYGALGGFDERYFMYCEDTDLCLRLQLAGYTIKDEEFEVIHDAQRNSLHQPRHMWWHFISLLRLWCSGVFWRYWLSKQRKAYQR